MKNFTPGALLVSCMFLTACSDGIAPNESVAPQLAVGSGCHSVAYNIMIAPTARGFEGLVTGDLQGSVLIVFDGTAKFSGKTASNPGTATWTITGGIVSGLTAFTTRFDNRNHLVDRPGSPATFFENTGRHREQSGVEMANLHYTGTFTLVPSVQGDHDYRGVICP